MLVAVATSSRLRTLNVNMRIRNSERFTTGSAARVSWATKPARVTAKISAIMPVRPPPTSRAARSSSSTVSMMVSAIRSAAPR